jgi:hypothetical protein
MLRRVAGWALCLLAILVLGLIAALILKLPVGSTELRLSSLSFSAEGVRCPQCADQGIATKPDLIHPPAQAPIPMMCVEQSIRFQLKARNYFQSPGHITVGLSGTTAHEGRPRLVGRGIVLGRTEHYPDRRGCTDGARVQAESYWARDLDVPGQYNPPYPRDGSVAGRKGNELFPSSCSSQPLLDGTSYVIVVNVSCDQSIQYTMLEAPGTLAQPPTGFVIDSSQLWAVQPEVALVPMGRRGWWIGHVMAPTDLDWRVDIEDIVVRTQYLIGR